MTNSDSTSQRIRFTQRAFSCHLCLAVLAGPLAYATAGLQDLSEDVIALQIVFFVIPLGLPALVFALYALYFTVKTQEPMLWTLFVTLSGFFPTLFIPTPSVVYVAGGGLYMGLVIGLWLIWLRRRRRAAYDDKVANGAQ